MSTPEEREARLRGVVETYRQAPFAWGIHDCVLFAARCVDAQIGTRFETNIQRDYKYQGALAATRLVIGAGGWDAIIGRYLGPPVPAEQLEFGDVVLGHDAPPLERTTMVGICDEELFIAPGSLELTWLPMKQALKGWKISDIADRQQRLLYV